MAVDWKRLDEGVAGALAADGAERDEWLNGFCDGDIELRGEIVSLLSSGSKAKEFLEKPIGDASLLLGDIDTSDPAGRQFGSYTIVREIGRGGMGAVFIAERNDGAFYRQVALKIINQTIPDSVSKARFRRERQILATLDHPNIARLLDGGLSDLGEPFLVMEYIDGIPIVEYASKLDLRDRLRLFLRICSAVSYAHRNLVIHRDIKPANILVTADGEPKLLDFGLAKILDVESNETRTATVFRALTPAYASPEQLMNEPVTTSSDIYSLGVLLYELVTGQRPFEVRGKDLSQIMDTVLHKEPPRMNSVENSGNLQSALQTSAGDLETIVRKALRKKPENRYPSADSLADDLRRYLDGLPITARPQTVRYRATKFVKRNRVVVTAGALVLISLIAGLVTSVWQARAAARERDQARQEQIKAEQLNTFLQEILSSASPEEKGKDAKVLEILNDAYQSLDTRFADQPELKAQALLTIGQTYNYLDLTDESIPALRRALELNSTLYGADSHVAATCKAYLAQALLDKASMDEAETLLKDSIAVFERSSADDKDLAFAMHVLGELYVREQKFDAAEPFLERSIEMFDHLSGPNNPYSAFALISLGRLHAFKGELDLAEDTYRHSIDIYRRLPERYAIRLAITQLNLGSLLVAKGKIDDGIRELIAADATIERTQGESYVRFESKYYVTAAYFAKNDLQNVIANGSEALAIARKLSLQTAPDYVSALEYRGVAFTKTGKAGEAEVDLRDAVQIRNEHASVNSRALALAKGWLGDCLLEQGKFAEAEPLLLERFEALQATNAPADAARLKTAGSQLAQLYIRWRKPGLAEKYRTT